MKAKTCDGNEHMQWMWLYAEMQCNKWMYSMNAT